MVLRTLGHSARGLRKRWPSPVSESWYDMFLSEGASNQYGALMEAVRSGYVRCSTVGRNLTAQR